MCAICNKKTAIRRLKRTLSERLVTRRASRKYKCTECGKQFFVKIGDSLY